MPQLMPVGVDVIVPAPVPAVAAVSTYVLSANVAVTDFAASIVTTQAPVPVHAPLHPVNVELAAALCVSVTIVPKLYVSVQSAPHEIPAGADVTVPVPVPAVATVSASVSSVNVAVTDFTASIVTMHAPVPEHAPPQPVNVEPVACACASITIWPKL
jgi:hypothetical protein